MNPHPKGPHELRPNELTEHACYMSPASDDSNSVPDAVNGDRTALGLLLLQEYDVVARHIDLQLSRELRNWIDVDDLMQQTMLRAVKSIHQLRELTRQGFRNWLLTLADNEVKDNARRLRRSGKGAPRSPHASSIIGLCELLSGGIERPSQGIRRAEITRAVRVGIASLADPQQNAVAKHHLEGKSLAETAADLNRSPAAVRGLLHRARRELRTFLGHASHWLSSR